MSPRCGRHEHSPWKRLAAASRREKKMSHMTVGQLSPDVVMTLKTRSTYCRRFSCKGGAQPSAPDSPGLPCPAAARRGEGEAGVPEQQRQTSRRGPGAARCNHSDPRNQPGARVEGARCVPTSTGSLEAVPAATWPPECQDRALLFRGKDSAERWKQGLGCFKNWGRAPGAATGGPGWGARLLS